jgi:hypothetical protein
MGKLEEQVGNGPLAREYFSRFLNLFGSSDVAFPEISDAREYIE